MARNVLKPNSGKKTKQTRTKSPSPSRIKAGERNIILTATCVLLGVMLWMHWTGCFNELKASNSSRFYIQNDQFGIKIPTLYPIQGIDISLHQGKIDWKKLDGCLSNNPSIQFVFIKATEGKTRKDPYFLTNWEEAGKIGLIRGAYHYLLPNKSGKMQAELFLKTVELSDGDLLPVEQMQRLFTKMFMSGFKQLNLKLVKSQYYIPLRDFMRPTSQKIFQHIHYGLPTITFLNSFCPLATSGPFGSIVTEGA